MKNRSPTYTKLLNAIAAAIRQAEPLNGSGEPFRSSYIEWQQAAKSIAVDLTDNQREYDWFCKLINIV